MRECRAFVHVICNVWQLYACSLYLDFCIAF